MDIITAMDKDWISKALKYSGLSGAELARQLTRIVGREIDRSAVQKMKAGQRKIAADEMIAISTITKYPVPSDIDGDVEPARGVGSIVVKGEVAAGVWLDFEHDTFEPEKTTIATDSRFPSHSMYALRVKGTSINRIANDGTLLLCLDVWEAPRSPKDGDWVIARRMRNGSVETTVKLLKIAEDGTKQLWPHSTDPKFQTPLLMSETESDSIEIIAFVVEFIRPATVF